MITNDPTHRQLLNALHVLTATPHIRKYLTEHDPKALEQAENAIEATMQQGGIQCASLSGDFRCDRPALHKGPHGCYLDRTKSDDRGLWHNTGEDDY
jgi:hypothetical protein